MKYVLILIETLASSTQGRTSMATFSDQVASESAGQVAMQAAGTSVGTRRQDWLYLGPLLSYRCVPEKSP